MKFRDSFESLRCALIDFWMIVCEAYELTDSLIGRQAIYSAIQKFKK